MSACVYDLLKCSYNAPPPFWGRKETWWEIEGYLVKVCLKKRKKKDLLNSKSKDLESILIYRQL